MPSEKEFLLPPYTAMQVLKVSRDDVSQRHRIVLKVASDNKDKSEDLELSPRI